MMKLGRPPQADRTKVQTTTLTLRLTQVEREGLQELTEKRQAELRAIIPGAMLSSAAIVRSLIIDCLTVNGIVQSGGVGGVEAAAVEPVTNEGDEGDEVDPRQLSIDDAIKSAKDETLAGHIEKLASIVRPNPLSWDELLDAIRRLEDPKMGMTFVPNIVREFGREVTLQALSEAGDKVELRPESGMGRVPKEDLDLCSKAIDGTPLTWLRLRGDEELATAVAAVVLADDSPPALADSVSITPPTPPTGGTVRQIRERLQNAIEQGVFKDANAFAKVLSATMSESYGASKAWVKRFLEGKETRGDIGARRTIVTDKILRTIENSLDGEVLRT